MAITTTITDDNVYELAGPSDSVNVAAGAAAADRLITVVFDSYHAISTGGGGVTACTIGGVTATPYSKYSPVVLGNGFSGFPADVWYAIVPSGTTPLVAVTISGASVKLALTIRTVGDATAQVVDIAIAAGSVASPSQWGAATAAADDVVVLGSVGNSSASISFSGVDSQTTQRAGTLTTTRAGLKSAPGYNQPLIDNVAWASDGAAIILWGIAIGPPRDPYLPVTPFTSGAAHTFQGSGTVKLICYGGGAGGGSGEGGGGGGAFAETDVAVSPGDIVYASTNLSAAVPDDVAGVDAWLRVNTNAAPTTTADGALAKGGGLGTTSTGGTGGQASASVGTIKFSGGNGAYFAGVGGGGGCASRESDGYNAVNGTGGSYGDINFYNWYDTYPGAGSDQNGDGASPGGGGGTFAANPAYGGNNQVYFLFTPLTDPNALTAPLFTDTDTFFAPAVVGPRVLSPSLFTDTDAFFTPTVVRGAVFGDLVGTLQANNNTIPTNFSATGSVAVLVGDVVVSVVCQQTTLTVTGVTDNLGNTYSAQNAGTDAGNVTGRVFYTRVTNAGTLTSVTAACTTSANDGVHIVGVFRGPFTTIDANPANITSDVTSPFTCPSSGTLAQAAEVVIGWGVASHSASWSTSSPSTQAIQLSNSTTIKAALNYRLVSATTAISPAFTAASNPGQAVLGTLSFKRDLTQPLTASLFDDTDSFFSPTVSQSTGGQNLDAPLYTDTDSFFSATITTGAVGLTAALFSDTDTFFNPTVSATYALTAALFSDTDAFFAATVTRGAVTLTPGLFTDTDSFFSPAVTGAYTLAPPLFTDSDTFFSATVALPQPLTVPLFTDSDAFFTAVVSATYALTPALYADTDSFFAATISTSYTLTAGLFVDSDAFFSPVVAQTQALTAPLFTDNDTFFTPVITVGGVTLTASLFTDTDLFHSPVVSSGSSLLAPDPFIETDTFFSATVTRGSVTLAAALFSDADSFYAATVTAGSVTLTPGLFTDADAFFAAAAKNVNPLAPPLLEDTDTFFAATVTSSKTLAPALFVDTDAFFSPLVERGTVRPALFTDADVFFTPAITTGPVNLTVGLFVDTDFFQNPVAAITFGREGGGTSATARRDPRLKPGLQQLKARPPAPKKKERELPEWHPEAQPEPELIEPAELESLAEVIDPRLMPQMDALSQMRAAIAAAERAQIEQDEQDAADIADVLALLDGI